MVLTKIGENFRYIAFYPPPPPPPKKSRGVYSSNLPTKQKKTRDYTPQTPEIDGENDEYGGCHPGKRPFCQRHCFDNPEESVCSRLAAGGRGVWTVCRTRAKIAYAYQLQIAFFGRVFSSIGAREGGRTLRKGVFLPPKYLLSAFFTTPPPF